MANAKGEVLSQGAADALIAKMLQEQSGKSDDTVAAHQGEKFTRLVCIWCGATTRFEYDDERRKATSYMVSNKSWTGKPCPSITGHCFVSEERYERHKAGLAYRHSNFVY
jgi:hypothetical protein